jgi:hypothetical protein
MVFGFEENIWDGFPVPSPLLRDLLALLCKLKHQIVLAVVHTL